MAIHVLSRKRGVESILARHPQSTIIDVTSRAPRPWVELSPFYPHGDIPVPFSPGLTGQSVEGVWQALKVFERADVDLSKLQIESMRNIKRSSRVGGRVLGHRKGVCGSELLSYRDARRLIYLPAYRWMLMNKAANLVESLRNLAEGSAEIVLLDYNLNGDVDDLSRPLSHAALIRSFIEGTWPVDDTK